MLVVAAVIIASVPQFPRQPASAALQATATVRILSGVRVRLGERHLGDGFITRESVLRTAGSAQPAKLIEFE